MRHSDLIQQRLESDQRAAFWHTYKPTPAQLAQEQQAPVRDAGAAKWMESPHVRRVDPDITTSVGPYSPRFKDLEVAPHLRDYSPGAFNRKDYSKIAMQSTEGASLKMPSYGESLFSFTNEADSGRASPAGFQWADPHGSSPLAPSPHRRGKSTIVADSLGLLEAGIAPRSSEVDHAVNSLDSWLANQTSPRNPGVHPAALYGKNSFHERMHQVCSSKQHAAQQAARSTAARSKQHAAQQAARKPSHHHISHHTLLPVSRCIRRASGMIRAILRSRRGGSGRGRQS